MERQRISSTVTIIKGDLEPQDSDAKLSEILGPKYSASRMQALMRLELARRRVNIGYDPARIEAATTNLGIAFKGLLVAAVRTGQPAIEMDVPFLEQEKEDFEKAISGLSDRLRTLGYLPVVSTINEEGEAAENETSTVAYRLKVDINDRIEE